MGCTNTKVSSNPAIRMMEYERLAASENDGLKLLPNSLDSEEWREGLISSRTFFNWFHAGYYSAYIQNPNYMLIIDFRSLESWSKERVATSIPFDRLHQYENCLSQFNIIILYDKDGSTVGNIKSPLRRTYQRLRGQGLDPRIVLGGLFSFLYPSNNLKCNPYLSLLENSPDSVSRAPVRSETVITRGSEAVLSHHSSSHQYGASSKVEEGECCSVQSVGSASTLPIGDLNDHLQQHISGLEGDQDDYPEEDEDDEDPIHELEVVRPDVGMVEPQRRAIHWLPSMIIDGRLYLGRAEHSTDTYVIKTLGITHILSTSRVRCGKIKGLVYILVNKTSFSLSTIKLTNSFIHEALSEGGRILVHGCDGLDQSAAVVVAALMLYYSASLEDCLWFVENSKGGIAISEHSLGLLLRLEEEMFGRNITQMETLWV